MQALLAAAAANACLPRWEQNSSASLIAAISWPPWTLPKPNSYFCSQCVPATLYPTSEKIIKHLPAPPILRNKFNKHNGPPFKRFCLPNSISGRIIVHSHCKPPSNTYPLTQSTEFTTE